MEATTILPQSQLQSLVSSHFVVCPSCKHDVEALPSSKNDAYVEAFCECGDCGSLYCGRASNDCQHKCPLDEVTTKDGDAVIVEAYDDLGDVIDAEQIITQL